MVFTPITDDVPLQPGFKAYNLIASGNIYKGQGVCLIPGMDNTVGVPDGSSQRLIGVAPYGATDGEPIAIYAACNIVRAKLSGAITAGTFVGLYYDGMLSDLVAYPYQAIVTKGVAATGDGEVLILPWTA